MTYVKILFLTFPNKSVRIAGCLLIWVMLNTATLADNMPERVVSMNLCTDQLVLQLADRRNIASITYMADDPKISYFAKRAIGHQKNFGLAEEIIPLKPDLIMAGAFSGMVTTSILRRLKYNIVVFEIANDFDSLRKNIRKAGRILGKQSKAERLIGHFDKDLEKFFYTGPLIPVVILQPRAAGTGKISLIDNILRKSGLKNISAGTNSSGVGWVTIEEVVVAKPEIIIADSISSWPSLGHQAMLHPVYKSIRNDNGMGSRRIQLPANLWNCGGVQVVKAVQILDLARDEVLGSRLSNGTTR